MPDERCLIFRVEMIHTNVIHNYYPVLKLVSFAVNQNKLNPLQKQEKQAHRGVTWVANPTRAMKGSSMKREFDISVISGSCCFFE
jgi:hypothetical protein